MITSIVEARNVSKVFPMAAGAARLGARFLSGALRRDLAEARRLDAYDERREVAALRGVSLRIAPGEYIGVVGPSGCGKSTLLHVLGVVDVPTSGEVLFQDREMRSLSDAERSRLRLREIGFVFQRFFLLPMLTAWENVELPQAEAGVGRVERRERTRDLLEYVGLAARAGHRPSELSGGEMQRVAIARALANRPRLLLADEPTGELDQATGDQIISLIDRLHADGMAVLVVTHDPAVARRAHRLLRMRDGQIVEETVP